MRKSSRAIIIENNKIYLIKRYKNGKTYWVTPGGGIEDNETPIDALTREIIEELGLMLCPNNCQLVYTIESTDNTQYFFKCDKILKRTKPTGEELNGNNPKNTYQIDLVNINELKNTTLLPEEIKEFIIKQY